MKRWLCMLLVIVMGLSVGAAALAEDDTIMVDSDWIAAADGVLEAYSLSEIVEDEEISAFYAVTMALDFSFHYGSVEEAMKVFNVTEAFLNGAYIGCDMESDYIIGLFFAENATLIMMYDRDSQLCVALPAEQDLSASELKTVCRKTMEERTDAYIFVSAGTMSSMLESLSE